MARTRISTTVDATLLAAARKAYFDRSLHDDDSRTPARCGSIRPDPVPRASAVNLDSVESVSVATLVQRLRRLSDERMRQVRDALAVAVACEG